MRWTVELGSGLPKDKNILVELKKPNELHVDGIELGKPSFVGHFGRWEDAKGNSFSALLDDNGDLVSIAVQKPNEKSTRPSTERYGVLVPSRFAIAKSAGDDIPVSFVAFTGAKVMVYQDTAYAAAIYTDNGVKILHLQQKEGTYTITMRGAGSTLTGSGSVKRKHTDDNHQEFEYSAQLNAQVTLSPSGHIRCLVLEDLDPYYKPSGLAITSTNGEKTYLDGEREGYQCFEYAGVGAAYTNLTRGIGGVRVSGGSVLNGVASLFEADATAAKDTPLPRFKGINRSSANEAMMQDYLHKSGYRMGSEIEPIDRSFGDKVSRADAFRKTMQALALMGATIVSSNESAGVITAQMGNAVTMGFVITEKSASEAQIRYKATVNPQMPVKGEFDEPERFEKSYRSV